MSMSEKLLDPQGRQRSKTISFRMSPEEAEVLDSLVAASGMTKQDYITSCLIDHRITVIPHTRTYKGLYDGGEPSEVEKEDAAIRALRR